MLYITIGMMCISVVFAVFTILISFCLKADAKHCSGCLHINWMCMGLIGMIYLLLTVFLQPLSIILLDFCEIVEPAFNDEDQFKATILPYTEGFEDMESMLNLCIFGDGNLQQNLPVGD